jgi:aryl-alcohol dehydrogenase-like predicted oxidoreductase
MSPINAGILGGLPEMITELKEYGINSMAQASLKFILQTTKSAVPIPGTKRAERIDEYLKVLEAGDVPEEIFESLIEKIKSNPDINREP